MKNFYRKCRLHVWLACLTAGLGLLSYNRQIQM